METRKTIHLDRALQPDASQQEGAALGMIDPGLPKIGDHITSFALEKIIHIGNMAVVYRALSTLLGVDYAFKICRPCSSTAYRRAFATSLKFALSFKLGSKLLPNCPGILIRP